jgi:hypothetical protein
MRRYSARDKPTSQKRKRPPQGKIPLTGKDYLQKRGRLACTKDQDCLKEY